MQPFPNVSRSFLSDEFDVRANHSWVTVSCCLDCFISDGCRIWVLYVLKRGHDNDTKHKALLMLWCVITSEENDLEWTVNAMWVLFASAPTHLEWGGGDMCNFPSKMTDIMQTKQESFTITVRLWLDFFFTSFYSDACDPLSKNTTWEIEFLILLPSQAEPDFNSCHAVLNKTLCCHLMVVKGTVTVYFFLYFAWLSTKLAAHSVFKFSSPLFPREGLLSFGCIHPPIKTELKKAVPYKILIQLAPMVSHIAACKVN